MKIGRSVGAILVGGVVFFAITPVSLAGNFSVVGVAARAQSMEAFTGVADDPSAVYYNPAGLTQIKDTQVNSSADYVMQHLDYTNSNNNSSSSSKTQVLAPSLFVASGKMAPIYLGFGIYAPFARLTEYSPNAAVFNLDQKSEIQRIDFVPTIATQLGQYISIGAGLVGSRVDASIDVLGLDQVAHGYGATAQGGVLVTLPEGWKLGVNYRGPENAHISGNGSVTSPLGTTDGGFNADFHFPGVLSAGVSWQAMQKLLLAFEYDYEMWSYLDEIKPNYANPVLNLISTSPVNAKNSSTYRAGLIYRPSDLNEFRLGAVYLARAVPSENIIPAAPDYTGAGGAIGYSRYYHNWRFDIGFESGKMFNETHTNTFFPGKYSGTLNTVLAGVNYSLA